MSNRIVGIFVCMMLLATFLTMTTDSQTVNLKQKMNNVLETSSYIDDVPVWKIGEKWTYEMDDIEVGNITSGYMRLDFGDLSLKVVDDTGSLYNSELSIRLGTLHLSELMKKFEHKKYLVLAAYNAGETRAGEWWENRDIDDSEAFIETVPFKETRLFVKRVLNSYYMYRDIYRHIK